MEVINRELDIAKRAILREYSFLTESGYEASYKEKNNKLFIESLEVEYDSEERGRRLTISYTKGAVADEIKYTFGVLITREPYNDTTDFFSLSMYLQSKNQSLDLNSFTNFTKEKVESALVEIRLALKEHCMRIIDGTEWLSGYYPKWDNV